MIFPITAPHSIAWWREAKCLSQAHNMLTFLEGFNSTTFSLQVMYVLFCLITCALLYLRVNWIWSCFITLAYFEAEIQWLSGYLADKILKLNHRNVKHFWIALVHKHFRCGGHEHLTDRSIWKRCPESDASSWVIQSFKFKNVSRALHFTQDSIGGLKFSAWAFYRWWMTCSVNGRYHSSLLTLKKTPSIRVWIQLNSLLFVCICFLTGCSRKRIWEESWEKFQVVLEVNQKRGEIKCRLYCGDKGKYP